MDGKLATLSIVTPFKYLPISALEEISAKAIVKHYRKGDHIIEREDSSKEVYVLQDGTVSYPCAFEMSCILAKANSGAPG
jgi:signal-transduction protein with cAMP-binding, CBS, and nucleotidyltransferase domain